MSLKEIFQNEFDAIAAMFEAGGENLENSIDGCVGSIISIPRKTVKYISDHPRSAFIRGSAIGVGFICGICCLCQVCQHGFARPVPGAGPRYRGEVPQQTAGDYVYYDEYGNSHLPAESLQTNQRFYFEDELGNLTDGNHLPQENLSQTN